MENPKGSKGFPVSRSAPKMSLMAMLTVLVRALDTTLWKPVLGTKAEATPKVAAKAKAVARTIFTGVFDTCTVFRSH